MKQCVNESVQNSREGQQGHFCRIFKLRRGTVGTHFYDSLCCRTQQRDSRDIKKERIKQDIKCLFLGLKKGTTSTVTLILSISSLDKEIKIPNNFNSHKRNYIWCILLTTSFSIQVVIPLVINNVVTTQFSNHPFTTVSTRRENIEVPLGVVKFM